MLVVIDLEPPMLETLLRADPLRWILLEHGAHQLFGLRGDGVPVGRVELQFLSHHVLKDFLVVISFEGWVATEEDVEDDTQAPHIALLVVVTFEHLWGNVVWRADNGVHLIGTILRAPSLR